MSRFPRRCLLAWLISCSLGAAAQTPQSKPLDTPAKPVAPAATPAATRMPAAEPASLPDDSVRFIFPPQLRRPTSGVALTIASPVLGVNRQE